MESEDLIAFAYGIQIVVGVGVTLSLGVFCYACYRNDDEIYQCLGV